MTGYNIEPYYLFLPSINGTGILIGERIIEMSPYKLNRNMNIEENKKLWAKIVAKAWCDEAFKAELLNNPEQVLKAEGVEIPEGVRVHVVEEQKPSTAEDVYLYLPPINETIIMDETEVKKAAKSCCATW